MKTRLPLDVETKVKTAFKINCIKNEENMSYVLNKFIEAFNKDPKGTLAFINREYENTGIQKEN